jgi:hypothetical protein
VPGSFKEKKRWYLNGLNLRLGTLPETKLKGLANSSVMASWVNVIKLSSKLTGLA